MYQVVKMHGDFEPWWFIEGCPNRIITREIFEDYREALACYKKECQRLAHLLPQHKEEGQMVAFWNPQEQRWCDECDDYLQQYHSLLLLDQQEIDVALSKQETSNQASCHFRQPLRSKEADIL